MKSLLAIAALVIAVGCSGGSGGGYVPKKAAPIPPASVRAGEETSLFPLAVGNSWTFDTTTAQRIGTRSEQKKVDVTFKVSRLDSMASGKRAVIDLIVDNKVADQQVWAVTAKGVYQISVGKTKKRTFSTPIPAIVFPIEKDKKFSWQGFDGISKMAYNSMIVGPQEVDTEEKRMSGIAVESKGTSVNPKVTEKLERTIWFVPGIGIVRIRESTSSTIGASELLLVLKSHKVK